MPINDKQLEKELEAYFLEMQEINHASEHDHAYAGAEVVERGKKLKPTQAHALKELAHLDFEARVRGKHARYHDYDDDGEQRSAKSGKKAGKLRGKPVDVKPARRRAR